MLNTKNEATAVAPAALDTQGDIILFRPAGETDFIDFGWVRSLAPNNNVNEQEFTGNRDGTVVTIAKEIQSVTISLGFGTISFGDKDIRALHAGSEAVAGAGAFVGVTAFAVGVNSLQGEALVIHKTGKPATNPDIIFYHPSASLRANGEGDENGKKLLNFTLDVLADADYKPSTALTDFGAQETPYGIILLTPRAKLDTVLTTLAD